MDELHQLHAAITQQWSLIKKYNSKLSEDSVYESLMAEVEAIEIDDPKIRDLLYDWVIRWMKYEDKKYETNT